MICSGIPSLSFKQHYNIYIPLRYVMLRAVRSVLYCNGAVRGKKRLTEGTNTFRLYLRAVSPSAKEVKQFCSINTRYRLLPPFLFLFLLLCHQLASLASFAWKLIPIKKKGLSPWMGYNPTTSSLLLQKKGVKKHYMSKNVRCTLFKRSLFYCPETPNILNVPLRDITNVRRNSCKTSVIFVTF